MKIIIEGKQGEGKTKLAEQIEKLIYKSGETAVIFDDGEKPTRQELAELKKYNVVIIQTKQI